MRFRLSMAPPLALAALLPLASLVLPACASSDSAPAGVSPDGAAPESRPEDAGALGPATSDGFVLLMSAAGSDDVAISAQFRSLKFGGDPVTIPPDGCTVFDNRGGRTETYAPDAHAGTMKASAGGKSITLPWVDSAKAYAEQQLEAARDVPITIEATGDAVPTFKVVSQRTRPITSLVDAAGGLDKSKDFDVTWSAGAAGQGITIGLDGAAKSVRCSTTADRSHFLIPASYVGAVADSAARDGGAASVQLTLQTGTSEHVRAGVYDIAVIANEAPIAVELLVR